MKKKLSLKYGVIFILVAMIATIVSVAFIAKPKYNKLSTPSAVFSAEGGQVSDKFAEDVLFSVEKVLIDAQGNYSTPITTTNNDVRYFLKANNEKIYVMDYKGVDGKHVVENNTFVKLDNDVNSTTGSITSKKNSEYQDAIMVSFGQYVLVEDNTYGTVMKSVELNGSNETIVYDDIRNLRVTGEHNGEAISNLERRSFNVGGDLPRYDFSYLITQDELGKAEGYYRFNFEYTKNGQDCEEGFEFYIVFNSSYTTEVKTTSNTYNSYPTLGWNEVGTDTFEKENEVYKDGVHGITANTISYPTLTYDYTRYKMNYSINSYKKTTKYTYTFRTATILSTTTAYLDVASSAGTVPHKMDAYTENGANLVTIMFTEPGVYNFSFEYIYKGYNDTIAPPINGLEPISDKTLTIHGLELVYSKVGFASARLRYYELSVDDAEKLDLIVADGCEYGKESQANTSDLEFVYSKIESNERAGTVVLSKSQDALISAKLTTQKLNEGTADEITYQKYFTDNYNKASEYDADEIDTTGQLANNFKTILDSVDYVKTNQGSLWFTYNDYFADGSFYYYSATRPSVDKLFEVDTNGNVSSTARTFTNQTSFNEIGYYLVFMNVDILGGQTTDRYYQVYAFQYSTDTVDIVVGEQGTIYDEGGTPKTTAPINQYTNKSVDIAWKNPDIFEKKLTGYYYISYNNDVDRDDLIGSREYPLENGATLGDGLTGFAEYLIQIQSEGQSSTYKMITIDRQNIEDVRAYVVKSSNSVYSVDLNGDGTKKELVSGITDSIVTLSWQEARNGKKASGANVTATYYYSPFVETSKSSVVKTSEGIATNYTLGQELGPFEDYVRPDSYNRLTYQNMFTKQGVYRTILKDDAGNTCQYIFIIDQTEAFFQVGTELDNDGNIANGELLTETSLIFRQQTYFNVGQNKIISTSSLSTDSDLYMVLSRLGNTTALNGLEIKYHTGVGSNHARLANLFRLAENKILVKNEYVFARDEHNVEDKTITGSLISATKTIKEPAVDSSASSTIRNIYIFGENNVYSSTESRGEPTRNSYITIEVNTDNSQGMAYYSDQELSDENLPTNGQGLANGSIVRLTTGAKLERASATSAKHVGFVWLMGTGSTAVSEVYYTYYRLNLSRTSANKLTDNNLGYEETIYYYEQEGDDKIPLYQGGSVYEENGAATDNTYGFASFSVGSSTPEGLYKVTRVYSGSGTESDGQYRNYYFIVDRKGIIDTNVGSEIAIKLLENETTYQEFSQFGIESGTLTYEDDSSTAVIERPIEFGVHLTTNKVPLTLTVPVAKFFTNSDLYSNYYDGKLRVRLYYSESMTTENASYELIYDGGTGDVLRVQNGYFNMNVYEYLTAKGKIALRDSLVETDSHGISQPKWITAEGTYVLLVEDYVEKISSGAKNNSKAIGFRIDQQAKPEVEISAGYHNANSLTITKADAQYSVTTNAEFIKINMPEYIKDDGKLEYIAQVDPCYLIIKQFVNGTEQPVYVNYPYSNKTGSAGSNLETKVVDGKTVISSVYLDTMLETKPLSTEIKYEITVRFKLSADGNNDNYINAYKKLDEGIPTDYYTTTYTIVIDRLAPTTNINNLVERDKDFIAYYNAENGVDDLFVDGYHETNSAIYFTKQYNAYYASSTVAMSKIYAFNVDNNTEFKWAENETDVDVVRVGYRQIDINNDQISLPVVNQNEYTIVTDYFETYGELFGSAEGYYEVIEIDQAGNVTQYVVNFTNSIDEFEMHFNVETTDANETVISANINDSVNIDAFICAIEGAETIATRNFYRLEIVDNMNNILYSANTKIGTDFDSLATKVAEAISKKGAGNYWIKVITASTTKNPYTFNVNLYDRNADVTLDIDKLKIENNGKYYLKLDNANVLVDGLWYIAKEVKINEDVYTGRLVNGSSFEYSDAEGNVLTNNTFICADETTYLVTVVPTIGEPQSFRFSTTGQEEFYTISGTIYKQGDTHYSFGEVVVKYDKVLFESKLQISAKVDGINASLATLTEYIVEDNSGAIKNTITIKPYIELIEDGAIIRKIGHLLEVTIVFEGNEKYNIVVDSRIGTVTLREFPSGDDKTIVEEYNVNEYTSVVTNTMSTGRMNLICDLEKNGEFKYVYTLYRHFEGQINETNITSNVTSITDEGSYWLIVKVYSQDGKVELGNKVFNFNVKAVSNSLYELITNDGQVINSNAVFTKDDTTGLGLAEELPQNVNFPLYITNKKLDVDFRLTIDEDQISEDDVTKVLPTTLIGQVGIAQYKLTIYKIDAGSYVIYFGIMEVEETSEIVKDLNIRLDNSIFTTINNTSTTVIIPTNNKTAEIVLEGGRVNAIENVSTIFGGSIGAKNSLLLDVYYNDTLVKTVEYNSITFSYSMEGNGNYIYVLRDKAGNIQGFVNAYSVKNTGEIKTEEDKYIEVNGVNLVTLREVVVTVRGVTEESDYAPIENAFYSEAVEMKLYANYMYVNGSISVTATRNGQSYPLTTYPYVFNEYGTYKVTISANYLTSQSEEEVIPLTKTFVFTILNEKEARKSIDLTSIAGYEITQILNNADEDITEEFKATILNANTSNSSYVSYDKVVEYAKALNTTYGKNTYTITYQVEDGIYPTREVTFKFTLNNETPQVDCSIGKGEKTNKGFDISFNAGMIYEQIGESFIYINDRKVATIDEYSSYNIQKVSTTFKQHGAGDYYVKLVSSSGNVIQSFKVTVTEPLNVWAIVIIVIVVIVVASVVTVVLVLRHRMRIR